jgi:hypothetical protein
MSATVGVGTGEERAMKALRGANVLRMAGVLAAIVLAVAIGGDRGGYAASAANTGSDPFDVLDLQIKPFVMLVFDTSGSMKFPPVIPPGSFRYPAGGDDPASRMWQAKRAMRDVTDEFKDKINMGLFTFSPLLTNKRLNQFNGEFNGDNNNKIDGPLLYVSNSSAARLFGWDPNNNGRLDDPADLATCGGATIAGFFCDIRDSLSGYDESSKPEEVFQSFGNRGYFSVPYPWVSKNPAGGPGGLSPRPAAWKIATPDTNYTIIGYDNGANPNGRLPGADNPVTPEAAPSNTYNNAFRVPACDPTKGECRYYLESRVYRTDRRYTWDRSATANTAKLTNTETIDCSAYTPPVGLTDDTITGTRPCIVMKDSASGEEAVFFYSSGLFENASGGGCDDPVKLVDIPPCNPPTGGVTSAGRIKDYMRLELPMSGTDPANMLTTAVGTANPGTATSLMNVYVNNFGEGIRSDGGTPIITAIRYARDHDVFPAPPTGLPPGTSQKRYLLILTDGEDGCTGYLRGSEGAAEVLADAAYDVYHNASDRRQAELFYVVYTNDASARVSNYVAQAGSGGVSTTGWSNTSETLGCSTGASCRNAIRATNIDDLKLGLRDAFSSIANSGEYAAARGTVVDTVFEYAALAGTSATAYNAATRYTTTLPVVLQSNISMPGFEGRLRAYRSSGTTPVLLWEAGAKLNARVRGTMGTVSCPGVPSATATTCSGEYTFAQLHGGSSSGPPKYTPATTALIQRRIITTVSNGVKPQVVPLWPPPTTPFGSPSLAAVAPSDTTLYPPGLLDGSAADGVGLGIGGLTFADLQTVFEACTGGDPARIPADCADATKQVARATKEAREITLAFTAGADVSRDVNALIRRAANGEILYKSRPWVLADSTNATPAIVGPPVFAQPTTHAPEYSLYMDGFRDVDNKLVGANSVENGFGLSNPDLDDPSQLPYTSSDPEKKPVMTVAYLPTNHMLHAFRAGPQSCTSSTCPGGAETGGEELYAYVPFDLLSRLQVRRRGQNRFDPVFMMASSLRVGDVWVPEPYTGPDGRTYPGKWRALMYAGRGPGGKYISAVDVTGVGPFTRASLDTGLPTVLWNRGNPDTTDGTTAPTATPNASTAGADRGVTDAAAYAKMGETWSVGALVPLDPARAYGREWVYWAGSGFSDNPNEGKTFYTLDALNGDVLYAADVASSSATTRTNFISANVTGHIPARLSCSAFAGGDRAIAGPAEAAFVGDLHGRLWKFHVSSLSTPQLVQDFGVNQPIGTAVSVALVQTTSGAVQTYLFGETGNDNRLAPPPAATPPFQLFAMQDSTTGTFSMTLSRNFPERFRGTVQPLAAAICSGPQTGKVVIFYVGTQFVPADSSTNCASTFDSIFYALDAGSNTAAFNLNPTGASTQEYAIWRNQKVPVIRGSGGKVTLDTAINAGQPPPAPAPPRPQPAFPLPAVSVLSMRFGSSTCN